MKQPPNAPIDDEYIPYTKPWATEGVKYEWVGKSSCMYGMPMPLQHVSVCVVFSQNLFQQESEGNQLRKAS